MNAHVPVLVRNALIFDGSSETLTEPVSLLITGDEISKISTDTILPPDNAVIIEGEGRVLTPGLIDSHVHICLTSISPLEMREGDPGYLYANTIKSAERMLMNGFTTVRDAAGSLIGVKQAIDEGLIPGPRIYPSGAMICSTGGHFDLRKSYEIPRRFGGSLSRPEILGISSIVDGRDEVLMASREQIRLGSSRLRLRPPEGLVLREIPLILWSLL